MSIFNSKTKAIRTEAESLMIRKKLEIKASNYNAIKASVLKKGFIVKFCLNYEENNEVKFCEVLKDIALKPLIDNSFDEYYVQETSIFYSLIRNNIIKHTDSKIIDKEIELNSFSLYI